MANFINKIKVLLQDKSIVRRVVFTVLVLAMFRLLSAIPIPSIDTLELARLLSGNQFLGLLDLFSGGGISRLSIVMLGVGPYITASIIMQLVTMMIPKLKAMYQEEGDAGRAKFSQYTRIMSVPLALLQAFGFLALLQNQNVLPSLSGLEIISNTIIIAGGSVLLMWLGELISEFGIGNGVSLIIFAGIVAALPTTLIRFIASFNPSQIPLYIIFLILAVVIITAVVIVTEAERSIPVTYAKQVRGNKVYGGVSTYLPLRLNQAGVIPIIFALSILLFPQIITNFLAQSSNVTLASIATTVASWLNQLWLYGIIYFVLVFLFTYFYTAVTFDPLQISQNLQRGGAFIPGVRPGEQTSDYLAKIVTRITFVGALFLGFVAILPIIMQGITGNSSLAIGGTALLIVVSVVLDLVKKLDAQATMRQY